MHLRLSRIVCLIKKGYISYNRNILREHSVKFSKLTRTFSTRADKENNCNVGTIGHVDHGKTTLTSAITYVLEKYGQSKFVAYDAIDKAPIEKARGITINIGHVGYRSKNRLYAHTDCPGHADFVKNMIAGASQMDGAVIVVAATDGQMPQTREHMLLANQIGIKKVIVFINKVDLVDSDVVELVELEMRELLEDYGYDSEKTPFVAGSALLALKGDKSEYGEKAILKLIDCMDEYFTIPQRDYTSPFLMLIDNQIPVRGRGTVVTGTIKQGTVKKSDKLVIMGYDITMDTAVVEIQVFNKTQDIGLAGENVGLLIKNIKVDDIKKGMALCSPRGHELEFTNHFEAQIYFLTKAEGGRDQPAAAAYIDVLHCNTWSVRGRMDLPKHMEMIMPGEFATVRFTLQKKMIIQPGDVFTIREDTLNTTATGKVTQLLTSRHLPIYRGTHRLKKLEKEEFELPSAEAKSEENKTAAG